MNETKSEFKSLDKKGDSTDLSEEELIVLTCDGKVFRLWYPVWSQFEHFRNLYDKFYESNKPVKGKEKFPQDDSIQFSHIPLTSRQLSKIIDLLNNRQKEELYKNYQGVCAYLGFNDMGLNVDGRIISQLEKIRDNFINNICPNDKRYVYRIISAIMEFNKSKITIKTDFIPDNYLKDVIKTPTRNWFTTIEKGSKIMGVPCDILSEMVENPAAGKLVSITRRNLSVTVHPWIPDINDPHHVIVQIGYRLQDELNNCFIVSSNNYDDFPNYIEGYQPHTVATLKKYNQTKYPTAYNERQFDYKLLVE